MNDECGNCCCDQGRECPGEPMIKTSRGAVWVSIGLMVLFWACVVMAIRSCHA